MKKIMLLGDSIRIGYAPFVKKSFEGKAEVYFPDENCRDSYFFFVNLQRWLSLVPDKNEIDIIHFNTGHWDVNHWNGDKESLVSTEQYKAMLNRIASAMKRAYPNAKLLFSLTTPMNCDQTFARTRTTEEIKTYNAAASELMRELDIQVCDLFGYIEEMMSPTLYKDACHFTEDGSMFLAGKVAEFIRVYI